MRSKSGDDDTDRDGINPFLDLAFLVLLSEEVTRVSEVQKFITDRLPQIEELCRAHHVQRLSIFGSAVRDDFNPETSDVDVRVEFFPHVEIQHTWGQLELKDELISLLGRKVDLIYRPVRNTYLRREIESSEVTVYAA